MEKKERKKDRRAGGKAEEQKGWEVNTKINKKREKGGKNRSKRGAKLGV